MLIEVEGAPRRMSDMIPHAFPEASNFTQPNK